MQQSDSILTSAMRGRVLAALASAGTLWFTLQSVYARAVEGLGTNLDQATLSEILSEVGKAMEATDAFLVAATSLVALFAATGSKVREKKREKQDIIEDIQT